MRQNRNPAPALRARLDVERLDERTVTANLPSGFTETVIGSGVTSLTAMEIAPNGDVWVLEKNGGVKRFRQGSPVPDTVANISRLGIRLEGERGLGGIAFDPDYAHNKYVYLYY